MYANLIKPEIVNLTRRKNVFGKSILNVMKSWKGYTSLIKKLNVKRSRKNFVNMDGR